jgi:hypothetical protein
VGDEVSCQGAFLDNPTGLALTCDRLRVGGSVFLIDGFHASGEVRLAGARIGSDLTLRGATLQNARGSALYAVDVHVEGVLRLNALASKPVGQINLDHADAHAFVDDEGSWPEQGMLHVNGFTYDDLGQTSPTSAAKRLEWLRLQPTSPFRTHPYEQMAKVLRGMGHISDARAILVAKHEDLRAYGKLRPGERFANWFWGLRSDTDMCPAVFGSGWWGGSCLAGCVTSWPTATVCLRLLPEVAEISPFCSC